MLTIPVRHLNATIKMKSQGILNCVRVCNSVFNVLTNFLRLYYYSADNMR